MTQTPTPSSEDPGRPFEWMSAFVPLGACGDEDWTPVGGGILIIEPPTVWLCTTRSVLEATGEAPIAAWVSQQEGGTVLDLTSGLERSGLDWVRSPDRDLAISLFPVDPAWGLKAFAQNLCLGLQDLQPLTPVYAVGCPYGLGGVPASAPKPVVLDGIVAGVDVEEGVIRATAPCLPRNAGGPLVVSLPGKPGAEVALVGMLTRTTLVPDEEAPPLRLAEAVPARAIVDLIRSDEARAQRGRVVSEEQGS